MRCVMLSHPLRHVYYTDHPDQSDQEISFRKILVIYLFYYLAIYLFSINLISSNEGEQKGNGNGKEKKLSDPSPFNNILNNIQFLLAVIKHSYF